MSTQLEQLNKLKKFAKLETSSARFLSLFRNISEVDERINIVVKELKKQLDNTSNIKEDQLIKLARNIVVKGDQGKQGERGLPGKEGLHGKIGLQGRIGNTGLQGNDGPEGKEGPQGKNADPIDVERVIKKAKIDASQITNLPKPQVIERTVIQNGGGSSGVERILSGDKVIRQGASEINFGDNLTVTRTPNGVKVDVLSIASLVVVDEALVDTGDRTTWNITSTFTSVLSVHFQRLHFSRSGVDYTISATQIVFNAALPGSSTPIITLLV